MSITAVGGVGGVGGGLACCWGQAGETVTRLGRDATDATVVLVVVPFGAIADAPATVSWPG